MRVHFLLLGLFATLEVLALDVAVPWEMMYFYAAYKAEWLSGMDGTARQIATECVRSNRGKDLGSDFDIFAAAAGVPLMCSFDDFVKHVGTAHTFSRYQYTVEGDSWAVDTFWEQIRDNFAKMGVPGVAIENRYAFDFTKLLPKVDFGSVDIAHIPYPPVIQQIGNALQSAREFALHQTGTPIKAALTAQIFFSGEYSRIAQQYRVKDAVSYPTRAANAYINGAGRGLFTLVTKPPVLILPPATSAGVPSTAPVMDNYNSELDWDATLESNGATNPQKNAFRRAFAKGYNLNDPKVIDHNNVIAAYKGVVDFISMGGTKLGCRLPLNGAAPQKRSLISLEGKGLEEIESTRSSYQSHLVPMDINFRKMDVRSFGHLMNLGVVSV